MALTPQQHLALEKAFYAEGYDRITMSYIAEAIGFTRRALYHHYSSKSDAFRDSVIFQNEQNLKAGEVAAAQAFARGDNAIDVIHALLDARFGDQRRRVARSAYAQELADTVFRLCGDIINEFAARLQRQLVEVLDELQRQRKLALRSDVPLPQLAFMLAASVRGVNQSRPLTKEQEFSPRYREILTAVLRGSTK